jgi:hypothetical protein
MGKNVVYHFTFENTTKDGVHSFDKTVKEMKKFLKANEKAIMELTPDPETTIGYKYFGHDAEKIKNFVEKLIPAEAETRVDCDTVVVKIWEQRDPALRTPSEFTNIRKWVGANTKGDKALFTLLRGRGGIKCRSNKPLSEPIDSDSETVSE